MNKNEETWEKNFFQAILSLRNEVECKEFFEDICTIKEFQDLIHRLEVARLLSEGKVFNEISRITGASSATISRVNKCLLYGAGGYRNIMKHLEEKGIEGFSYTNTEEHKNR